MDQVKKTGLKILNGAKITGLPRTNNKEEAQEDKLVQMVPKLLKISQETLLKITDA